MVLEELERLESRVYSETFAQIEREQREYRKGVEEGMAVMFKAVRERLSREESEKRDRRA